MGLSAEQILSLPGVLGGLPKLRDRDAKSQGQGGAALRYYLDAIETEFAAYYLRFHDKQPTVSFGRCSPISISDTLRGILPAQRPTASPQVSVDLWTSAVCGSGNAERERVSWGNLGLPKTQDPPESDAPE